MRITEDTLRRLKAELAARTYRVLSVPRYSPAAVAVLLFLKDGEYHMLFTKRTDTVEHHRGEISFPGGRRDPEDVNMLDTALRETWEEMGVRREDVTVLGRLDDTSTRTGFVISSFVGVIPYPYPFKPSAHEIAEVLEAPVSRLMSPVCLREEAIRVDGKPVKMYSYAYEKHLIVGATARIVHEFLGVLQKVIDQER